jgi:hypothetical protein
MTRRRETEDERTARLLAAVAAAEDEAAEFKALDARGVAAYYEAIDCGACHADAMEAAIYY